MSFGSKILKYREDIIRDMAKLVAIPSVRGEAKEGKPFGDAPAEALDCFLEMAERFGLSTKNIGYYAGHAEYGQGDEVAAVLAHVDVVPVGEGWQTDPYTLTQKENCYYGRGTADDKGAAVAALYALKVLQEENVQAKRRIRVIVGAGEETGSDDMERYFEKEPLPVMGFTPDAEYGICNREKGLMRACFTAKQDSAVIRSFRAGTVVNAVPAGADVELACTAEQGSKLETAAKQAKGQYTFTPLADGVKIHSAGTACHAMRPQDGFNAATHLIALLFEVFSSQELGTLVAFLREKIGTELDGVSMGVKQSDEESGPLTLNLGLVEITAEKCTASIDIRYPVTSNGKPIEETVRAKAAEAGIGMEVSGEKAPLYLPSDSAFLSLLKGAYQEVMGEPASLYSTGGGTYARELGGRGVAFGLLFADEPDRRLHNTDEHIDIDRFMMHAQICLEAMYRMCTE